MKYLVGANFKMNKSFRELRDYLDVFIGKYACFSNVDLAIAPITAALSGVADLVGSSCLNLAAQNMHYESAGAYTGEVSPDLLKELGCKYVIVGHSERRALFHETDETINRKVRAAIERGIRPILCVGENLHQKDLGISFETVRIQLAEGLVGVADTSLVDVAYEPVWAIGTGRAAESSTVAQMHTLIRAALNNRHSRIIYGGSVNDTNAAALLEASHDINGFLVGSASLDAEKFLKIAQAASAKNISLQS